MKSVKSLKHRRHREATSADFESQQVAVQEGQSQFYYEVESPPPSLVNSVELTASGENSYVSFSMKQSAWVSCPLSVSE